MALWECLPIAILMQILATCATIIETLGAPRRQNFNFTSKKDFQKESAVGKMASLIILQQHACEKQHACERVKICSPTSRNTPTSQRLLILRSPCVAESYFLLEQKPVNSIHFRNGWMKFTLFPNQDLQALHTGGKQ